MSRKNMRFKIDGVTCIVYKKKGGLYAVNVGGGLIEYGFPSIDDVKKMFKAVIDGKCSLFNYDHSFNY